MTRLFCRARTHIHTHTQQPGSSPDAAYTYMNLYIVTMKKDGVKVVESFGTYVS